MPPKSRAGAAKKSLPPRKTKYRVGVIASGRIAREHGRGWTECEHTQIVALGDVHPESLLVYGDDFGVPHSHGEGVNARDGVVIPYLAISTMTFEQNRTNERASINVK